MIEYRLVDIALQALEDHDVHRGELAFMLLAKYVGCTHMVVDYEDAELDVPAQTSDRERAGILARMLGLDDDGDDDPDPGDEAVEIGANDNDDEGVLRLIA